MLGVALAAIFLACLLMVLILYRYDFKPNAKLAALETRSGAATVADPGRGTIASPTLAAC